MMTKTGSFCYFLFLCIFSIAQNNYNVYFGNLHSHTSYSDGSGTPSDAFAYAKDVAHLDFLAVTDHMEQLLSFHLSLTNSAADAATNSSFVGIAGYEWGSPYYGHVNVFNATEMPSPLTYSSWSDFREWMLTHNPPSFAQFNHPGDEPTFNNWYNFEYKGEATDSCFHLLEFQTIQEATDWYEVALNNGWHVSPVWNQDNHSPDWGTKNDGRAGIWSTALTRTALFDAINKGRTFATMDKNASVWIRTGNYEMGQTTVVSGITSVDITLNDADNEVFSSVEFVTNLGVVFTTANINSSSVSFDVDVTGVKYLFVRAIQADGDYIWSAPVYFDHQATFLKEINNNFVISVFPNPVEKKLFLTLNSEKNQTSCIVSVIDITGKELLSDRKSVV